MKKPEVLVVHCVDTEGPIGGNVRRRPDGSKEFLGTWKEITRSVASLTSQEFREWGADSFGNPYVFNWFIMDFIGFRTNPKRRVAKHHDTYDHFKALPTKPDGFYWHYHHPPADGRGDQWSERWDSSEAYLDILLHRLVEREDWPEAYRAGGTIEDNAQSQWLEQHMLVDYSNRVSERSQPTNNIFDFNWHGAPAQWGSYHPSRNNLLRRGSMRRFIMRSVDLWSRLHELTVAEVEAAFAQAEKTGGPVILSYFSHDHRDMNDETRYVISLLNLVAERRGIPWRSMRALEALQESAGLRPVQVRVRAKRVGPDLQLSTSRAIYQPTPWVGAQLATGQLQWLPVTQMGPRSFRVEASGMYRKVVVGGTSLSGNKFVQVVR